MNNKNGKTDDGAALIPAQTPAEPGYEKWRKSQLAQAVADLDDPAREEIGHETVFKKPDAVLARRCDPLPPAARRFHSGCPENKGRQK